MAKLIFEGTTHADLVQQVRAWLTDLDGADIVEGTVVVEGSAEDRFFGDNFGDDRVDGLRDLLRSLRKIAPGVVEDEAQLLALLARLSGVGGASRTGSDTGSSVSSLLQWFVETAQKANSATDERASDDDRDDPKPNESEDW